MRYGKLPADKNDPKKIGYRVLSVVEDYLSAVWHGGYACDLEALCPEGDSDDGYAKKYSEEAPREEEPKSTE